MNLHMICLIVFAICIVFYRFVCILFDFRKRCKDFHGVYAFLHMFNMFVCVHHFAWILQIFIILMEDFHRISQMCIDFFKSFPICMDSSRFAKFQRFAQICMDSHYFSRAFMILQVSTICYGFSWIWSHKVSGPGRSVSYDLRPLKKPLLDARLASWPLRTFKDLPRFQ